MVYVYSHRSELFTTLVGEASFLQWVTVDRETQNWMKGKESETS